jgi:hypothetical protein
VIEETPKLPTGGTLNVHLAVHALRRGYEAVTWVCNTRHMDPTWFQKPTDLAAKLTARIAAKGLAEDPRYGPAAEAVQQYIELGGRFVWGDLTPQLIAQTLAKGLPILTGTNGTYLYQCARETEAGPDDVAGDAFGHFIVLGGYRSSDCSVAIADPLLDNPAYGTKYYRFRRRQSARRASERLDEADSTQEDGEEGQDAGHGEGQAESQGQVEGESQVEGER